MLLTLLLESASAYRRRLAEPGYPGRNRFTNPELKNRCHGLSAKAYRWPEVRMYKVSSAIAGVALTRSPNFGFVATTSALPAPALRTVTMPSSSEVK